MRYFFFFLSLMTTTVNTAPLYHEDYSSLIEIGNHAFATEIVNTPTKMQLGMMYRPKMADEQAMLFVYPRPQRMAFWMKNTLLPLDMLFFDALGRLQEIKRNIPPCKTSRCPTYPSRHNNILYVVEVKGGTAERLNLQVGDKLNACGI